MRPHVPLLDSGTLAWAPLGPPGLYSRLLSRDPQSGARTALQCMRPQEGYQAPPIAHFHHTYEEILVVRGCFSFDSKHWLEPRSYCFHPPETVHGFKSAVREESWFLSRVGRNLDVNLVPEPKQLEPYYVSPSEPSRRVAVLPQPEREIGWQALALGSPQVEAQVCVLSRDPASGEGSVLLRLPAGAGFAARPPLGTYLEYFVLEGDIHESSRASAGAGGYAFLPPEVAFPSLTTERGAVLYVNSGLPIERVLR
jgi:hypothetical protein